MSRGLKIFILLVISLAILAAIVKWVGAEETLEAFSQAGTVPLAAIGGMTFLFVFLQSVAWTILNRMVDHRIPFRTLFGATLMGMAANTVTPSAYLGGEPVRVIFVGRRTGLPYHELAGTVVLGKFLEGLSFVFILLISAAGIFYVYSEDLFTAENLPWGISLLVVIVLGLILASAVWYSLYHRGTPLTGMVTMIMRLRPNSEKLKNFRQKTHAMERQVSRVFCTKPRGVVLGLSVLFLTHASVFVRPLIFFWLGWGLSLNFVELGLLFMASQVLLAAQLTPSGAGSMDVGMIGVIHLMGTLTETQMVAFLLTLRLWDAVVISMGALLGIRAGVDFIGKKRRLADLDKEEEEDKKTGRFAKMGPEEND